MALSANVKVYLGLVTNYYDTAPTWSEITSYVEEVEIDRGRNDVNRPFDAGTANIRLNNRTRLFDPNNSSGTYYAYFGKRLQLKIEATYGATTYPMFRGWVAGWPQDYPEDAKNSIVNLQAFDIMGLLALTELGDNALDIKYSQYSAWWQLGDGTSTNIADATGNGRNGIQYGGTAPLVNGSAIVPGNSKLSSIGSLNYIAVYAPPTIAATTHSFSIASWIKTSSSTTTAAALQINDYAGTNKFLILIGDNNNTIYLYRSGTEVYDTGFKYATNTVYHIAFTYDGSTGIGNVYINGALTLSVSLGILTSTNSPSILFDNQISFSHLIYDQSTAWNQAEVSKIYQAGLVAVEESASTRIDRLLDLINFDNSTFENLSNKTTAECYNFNFNGSLIDAIQTAADTEWGYLFADRAGKLTLLDRYFESTETTSKNVQVTFSDQADIAYNDLSFDYSGDDIINQAIVTTGSDVQALIGNTNSINSYSRRSQTVSTVLQTQAEAFSLAKFLIGSKPNVSYAASDFTVKPERKPAIYYPALLGLEIGHKVQIVRKPMGIGSNITFTGILNAVKHKITPSDWDIVLYAAPATQATGFFTLDVSALDGTDVLGY